MMIRDDRLGAVPVDDRRWQFLVWAPRAKAVDLCLTQPTEAIHAMDGENGGYFKTVVDDVRPGSRYLYRLHRLDGSVCERPDPASRSQPDGVHAASQIVSTDFDWTDHGWRGLPLSRFLIYELHVGTFSPEGTFEGVARHLDDLVQLGITAVELMPVAPFPGSRNWGYDGVYPFAVQHAYGGPGGLKQLVNMAHRKGLAVILDVVYNHLGPEGNYLRDFGPYFTDCYHTPWGEAVNFDGPFSDEVRRFFIENALHWVEEFHIDALRLDAVHAIMDFSARPFLEVLGRTLHRTAEALNRRIHLIAESALNDTRIIRPRELGGFALDAQWNDDFHHSLHTLLTGERSGYYQDFGRLEDLAGAFREGFVYQGRYSRFRQRTHGNSSRNVPARQLVVFAQNHDQVGNRMRGERLTTLVPFEAQKLAAGLVLLSPFIPLIFMGEEYGETAPFLYFISHTDPDLVAAVRRGRQAEFSAFAWSDEPPDPQDEATYRRSMLNRDLKRNDRNATMLAFYRKLIDLRTHLPALANLSKRSMRVTADPQQKLLLIHRHVGSHEICLIFRFDASVENVQIDYPRGNWDKRLDSADARWMGPGSRTPETLQVTDPMTLAVTPNSVVVFSKAPSTDGKP